jgi:hypothetical protein
MATIPDDYRGAAPDSDRRTKEYASQSNLMISKVSPVDHSDELEKPSEIQRHLLLNWRQGVGLMFLLTLPVLALFRVLGDGRATVEARTGGLSVDAEVPLSARHGNVLQLRLMIGASAVVNARRVHVEVSSDYLEKFREVRTQPEVIRFTADASVIIQDVSEGEGGAPVVIELTPEVSGWAEGRVRVSAESGEVVELPLKTFIFP